MMIDEIQLAAEAAHHHQSFDPEANSDILKKTEQSQRLEEASEGFTIIREDETPRGRDADHRQADGDGRHQPDYPPVDTTIFTALQRRASDIHMRPANDSVVIKFRIDGVLTQPCHRLAKEHHSTVISRIKVMSELDISERRVPRTDASA